MTAPSACRTNATNRPTARTQAPRGVMKQAADDLAQGLVDTDLHGKRGVERGSRTGGPAPPARPKPPSRAAIEWRCAIYVRLRPKYHSGIQDNKQGSTS